MILPAVLALVCWLDPGAGAPAEEAPIQRPSGAGAGAESPAEAAPIQRPSAAAGEGEGEGEGEEAPVEVEATPAEATPVEAAPVEATPAPTRASHASPAPSSAPIRASAARRSGRPEPRYHRAPFSDGKWATLIGQDVLMVFSTGYRVCGTITGVNADTVDYEDPSRGARKIARAMVTAVHEASWECAEDSAVPKVEWALPGSVAGLSIAGLGLVFGILQDVGTLRRPTSYAILGFPTLVFGAPVVGIAGRSTARDLRVRGVPWARAVGWGAFGGAALATVLWSIGYLGEVDALAKPGIATAAGGLGFAGAGLLAFDALRSRRELREVRRLDAQPAAAAGIRVGVAPIVQGQRADGVALSVGGRF
ncbi:MAG: hypothetical protein H6711_17660 [Myxococcales bacterium]|nr:hypothetical protein [Myxococcales bacterium]